MTSPELTSHRRSLILLLLLTATTAAAVGTASAQEAVEISDAGGLQGVGEDLAGNYVLVGDINASGISNFEPIGSREEPFTGTFDGGGHTVGGLSIDRGGNVGLFAAVGGGGVVKKVGLEGVDVTGGGNVGGVAGFSRGEVVQSYVTGSVEGRGNNVGGIVGWQRAGNVTKSYSTASVTGGIKVGGLVGFSTGKVSQSYAAGTVSATGRSGGLIGQLGSENQLEGRESVLRNSYWEAEAAAGTEGVGHARSGRGETSIEGVEGLSEEEMRGESAREKMPALDFVSTWETAPDSGGYPVLAWETGVLPGGGLPAPGFGFFAAAAALAFARAAELVRRNARGE